jgi:hypothetical protein
MTSRHRVGDALRRTALLGAGRLLLPTSPAFAQQNRERNVYFGEQHVHTSWSMPSRSATR